jgi:N-6 DNA Methylase
MSVLSWNEIKNNALNFAKEWRYETKEDAEAKSFWDGFFAMFGLSRKKIATFETKIKRLDGTIGFIDVFWKNNILVEHKSKGKDLGAAMEQAKSYLTMMKDYELPRLLVVCDFYYFVVENLETGEKHNFTIDELHEHIDLFGFFVGYEKRVYKEQDPVNIAAAQAVANLYDALKATNYPEHDLKLFMVRLLFCFFAEDTNIFEKSALQELINLHTNEKGDNVGSELIGLFEVLNNPEHKRPKFLPDRYKHFPFVNGQIFAETIKTPYFDMESRELILEACGLDWAKISPAIFGAMFQGVMNGLERRNLGAHYTSEKNILKVIEPLFLDELRGELKKAKGNKKALTALQKKLSELHFLDPACGCGNFLIITYRELRRLELELLLELNPIQQVLDIGSIVCVSINQMAGIEIDDFASQIAKLALYIIDHQMNSEASIAFGQYYTRLPLQKLTYIKNMDALAVDWGDLFNDKNINYIIGNPPFVGKQMQNEAQKLALETVIHHVKGAGNLDFVAGWFYKAAQFVQNTRCKVAFVSTNSISQGEQVGILWNELYNRFKIKIHFAHRTFSWTNEAKGVAAVHCVIIGFANYDTAHKVIFDYTDIKGEPKAVKVDNINPYLVAGKDMFVSAKTKPISEVPEMCKGSQPTDGGHLLLSDSEKITFLKEEPMAAKFIKPFLNADNFINSILYWCLWLKDASPQELKKMPKVIERLEAVKKMRLASAKVATVKWAATPTLFTEDRQPNTNYLLVPSTSSENRQYIPISFMDKDVIVSNACFSVPKADLYLFGCLSSLMHVAWVKYVAGRLKSDYRYSNTIVYNNYPFPKNIGVKQRSAIEKAAGGVLAARAACVGSSLADMYNVLTMPKVLHDAHKLLDKAVDKAYRKENFSNELERIGFLFDRYEEIVNPMFGGGGGC